MLKEAAITKAAIFFWPAFVWNCFNQHPSVRGSISQSTLGKCSRREQIRRLISNSTIETYPWREQNHVPLWLRSSFLPWTRYHQAKGDAYTQGAHPENPLITVAFASAWSFGIWVILIIRGRSTWQRIIHVTIVHLAVRSSQPSRS